MRSLEIDQGAERQAHGALLARMARQWNGSIGSFIQDDAPNKNQNEKHNNTHHHVVERISHRRQAALYGVQRGEGPQGLL